MKKITVVIPIYNVEKYIAKCLDSLINQDLDDYEILAVDDGSPDNSATIVESYSKKYNNIKLVKKENGGYGSVLEYAIQTINSEYFIVCDPDDWLAKNSLKKLYKFAKSNDLDLVISDRYNVYLETKKTEYCSVVPKNLNIQPNKVYTNKVEIQKFGFAQVSPHGKLYKTRTARNIKIPQHVSFTDIVLYECFISNAMSAGYLQTATAYYLLDRPGNTTTNLNSSKINDYLVCWNAMYEKFNSDPYEKELGLLYYRLYEYAKYIIYEYAHVDSYKKNYLNDIIKLFNKVSSKKNYINFYNLDKDKKRKLICHLFLNKFINKIIIKYNFNRLKKKERVL